MEKFLFAHGKTIMYSRFWLLVDPNHLHVQDFITKRWARAASNVEHIHVPCLLTAVIVIFSLDLSSLIVVPASSREKEKFSSPYLLTFSLFSEQIIFLGTMHST